jgi:predicted CoA-binding protein
MTQLLRYSEYLKYKISDIRMVQVNPFRLTGSAAQNNLQAFADPVDTHLFLNGEEADEVMQNLLTMGAKTCYLHAALSAQVVPQISISLNTEII